MSDLDIERNLYAGVDPGQSGGFAILTEDGELVDASPMMDTEKDVSDYLKEFAPRIKMAAIESVHSFPGQGVSSSFKFGMSYGALRMALTSHEIPFEYVTPGTWQKPFGLIESGRKATDSNREKKRRNKERAQGLFPSVKCTHAITDSLLIAEFARRKAMGLL